MMRARINLETQTDVLELVNIASKFDFNIKVKDGSGNCVDAKSIMGMLYSLEFEETYIESEKDIYRDIAKFVI